MAWRDQCVAQVSPNTTYAGTGPATKSTRMCLGRKEQYLSEVTGTKLRAGAGASCSWAIRIVNCIFKIQRHHFCSPSIYILKPKATILSIREAYGHVQRQNSSFCTKNEVPAIPGAPEQLSEQHNLWSSEGNLLSSPEKLLYLDWSELLHFLTALPTVSVRCVPLLSGPLSCLCSARRRLTESQKNQLTAQHLQLALREKKRAQEHLGESKPGSSIYQKDLREQSSEG